MNVTLPDGTVIQNVPDDMSQSDLVAKLSSNGYDVSKLQPPKASEVPTPSPGPSVLEKVYRGVKDPIDAGAQMLEKVMPQGFNDANIAVNNWIANNTGGLTALPKGGATDLIKTQEQDYQARRAAAGEKGIDAWRLAGNVASPVNLAIAGGAPQAATLLGKVASGIGQGAVSGVLNPVTQGDDFWKEKAKQAGMGAAAGAIVPTVMGAASRIVSPNASVDPAVTLLKNEGVKPTIGQTLGGWANAAEEKLQSLPIMGDMIRSARTDARNQFNSAGINRAAGQVGATVNGVGHEGVQEAGNKISAIYDQGKAMLGNFQIDQIGAGEIDNLQNMVTNLPSKEQGAFTTIWNAIKTDISPNGSILGDGFKRIDSKLGNDAAKFSGSTDAYQSQVGDAIKELQRIITDNAKRANPDAAALLNSADRAWANLIPIEGAARAAVNHQGIFTPSQLNLAIRGADQSVRDRATARGTALMQDLSSAGQKVLGDKIPDSGTVGRAAWGLGALATGALNPAIPAALVGGAGLYTTPLQSLFRGAVSSRPALAKPVAEAFNQASPYLVPAAAETGIRLMDN
jgi:hypothetical protein